MHSMLDLVLARRQLTIISIYQITPALQVRGLFIREGKYYQEEILAFLRHKNKII